MWPQVPSTVSYTGHISIFLFSSSVQSPVHNYCTHRQDRFLSLTDWHGIITAAPRSSGASACTGSNNLIQHITYRGSFLLPSPYMLSPTQFFRPQILGKAVAHFSSLLIVFHIIASPIYPTSCIRVPANPFKIFVAPRLLELYRLRFSLHVSLLVSFSSARLAVVSPVGISAPSTRTEIITHLASSSYQLDTINMKNSHRQVIYRRILWAHPTSGLIQLHQEPS